MYQLSDTGLRIEVGRGVLVIRDDANQTQRINEASMAKFEKFYSLWSVAQQMTTEADTFVHSWCFVPGFKETMCEAMKELGFKKPENFSPSQLEALLITYPEDLQIAGILFKLHQTYPKLIREPLTMGTTSGNQPRPSMTLHWPEFTHLKNFLDIARSKVGHCLKSWSIWLLQDL